MSEVIVEEVNKNDLTEAELMEFSTPDEIPVLEGLENLDNEDDSSSTNPESDDEPTTASTSVKKLKSKKLKKQQSTTSVEKVQSQFMKKYASGEITFQDYTKRLNEIFKNENEIESDYNSEDSSSTLKRIKKRSKKQEVKAEMHHAKKIKRALSPALQGLMGEANLNFARNQTAMAEKICLEIIRQEPMAAEPYLTLSQIYENTDEEKYVELLMIAAHVNSTSHQWLQVAEIMLEKKNLKQASYCYAKATRFDPKNLEIRLKRIEILRELGDEKHELHCRFCMLGFIPVEDYKFLISEAKQVAMKYHQEGLVRKSLDAMLKAYSKVPEYFSTEDVHSFIELLMNNKQYRKCLSVLVKHTGLQFSIKQLSKDKYDFFNLIIPNDMLIDLRTKMSICLIHLNAFNLIDLIVDNIITFIDIENGGDCYLDIAEALIGKQRYRDALKLLNPLVASDKYSIPGVWLLHADCLRAIGDFSGSINSYKIVIEKSHYNDAKLTLASLLKQEGRMEEAIEALSPDPSNDILCSDLLWEKCLLLKELGRIDEFLQNGYILLLRHCTDYRSRQEVQIVSNFTRVSDRLAELKKLRKRLIEVVEDLDTPEFNKTNEPTVSDDWNMFCSLVKTAWEHGRYTMLQRLTFAAMSSRRFQQHVKEIDFMGTIACLFNKEEILGYNKIRDFHFSEKGSPRFWNLFNLIIYITQDTRHHHFVTRLFDRQTAYQYQFDRLPMESVPPFVYILIANYFLLSNNYKYALVHYHEIYRRFPSPMIAMIIGILYIQIADQKFLNMKQNLVVQGINYFTVYRNTREPEAMAEILYNTGRFYHQIGIISVAKDYYEQALEVTNSLIESDPEILDLKRTIAFNLHVIYLESENETMARKVLYDNIVI